MCSFISNRHGFYGKYYTFYCVLKWFTMKEFIPNWPRLRLFMSWLNDTTEKEHENYRDWYFPFRGIPSFAVYNNVNNTRQKQQQSKVLTLNIFCYMLPLSSKTRWWGRKKPVIFFRRAKPICLLPPSSKYTPSSMKAQLLWTVYTYLYKNKLKGLNNPLLKTNPVNPLYKLLGYLNYLAN